MLRECEKDIYVRRTSQFNAGDHQDHKTDFLFVSVT